VNKEGEFIARGRIEDIEYCMIKNQIRRRNLNRSRSRKAIPQSLVIVIRTVMIRMRNHTKVTCHPKKLRYEFTSTYYTYIYKKTYKEIHKEIYKEK